MPSTDARDVSDRPFDALRPVSVQRRFTTTAAGSVLWTQGQTMVLATASVKPQVPPFFSLDRAGGWVTADYVMLPGSTPRRKDWPRSGHTDSRGTEIERLIGRTLRAAVDLSKIGPNTIHVDCQILQADGGTRTASICAGWVALHDALASLPRALDVPPEFAGATEVPARYDASFYAPTNALRNGLAAVSVGLVDESAYLDLDYPLDSRADVDLNVAMLDDGRFVEIQGTAESDDAAFTRAQLDTLLGLAEKGCRELIETQRAVID